MGLRNAWHKRHEKATHSEARKKTIAAIPYTNYKAFCSPRVNDNLRSVEGVYDCTD